MQVLKKIPSFFTSISSGCLKSAIRLTSSSQPSEYITTNLANGVGRYMCQLQRITFKFCKEHPGSSGLRDFIQNDLVEFAKQNPGVVVYLQPRRHRKPKLSAEYLNGSTQNLDVHQFSSEKIRSWLEFMRTRKGDNLVRLLKKQKTENPSIQGVWNPFTNKKLDRAIETFPIKDLRPETVEKSATEKIVELMNEQKLKN